MSLLGFIIGMVVVMLFSIIPFLINPILGAVWLLWLVAVAIYTIKKNKRHNK